MHNIVAIIIVYFMETDSRSEERETVISVNQTTDIEGTLNSGIQ